MRLTAIALMMLSPVALAQAPATDPAPKSATPSVLASPVAPAGVELYLISPKDGETLSGPVTVRFGLKGMGVAPAGIKMDKTGHHHLLVDVDTLPPQDQPIAMDERHLHFGGGQTETTLTLAPGKHTLQLLLGDYLHVPFNPPIASSRVTITVK